jgi:hypothetical protein
MNKLKIPVRFIIIGIIVFLILLLVSVFSIKKINFHGGCDERSSSFMQNYFEDERSITFCKAGDADLMRIESEYFKPGSSLSFTYSGYPNTFLVGVFLEGLSGKRIPLDLQNAHESWIPFQAKIPQALKDEEAIRVVAIDDSSAHTGWIGIGKLQTYILNFDLKNLLLIIIIIITVHIAFVLWLTFLMRYFDEDVAALCLIVAVGFFGIASFFIFYANRNFGIALSLSLLLLAFAQGVFLLKHGCTKIILQANSLLLPVSSFALFVIIVGYYPYADNADWIIPANRWLNLPIDNWIPKIFADQVWEGRIHIPMLGDWLSSDRPPLQTGMYLIFYPLAPANGFLYQALGSILQAMVFIPIALILRSVGLSKLVSFGVFIIGLSSLMVVHTLFVWPKLLSSAYLLILYLVTLTPFRDRMSPLSVNSLIIGSSAAFAMLSHGGAIFALFAIALIYVLRQSYQVFNIRNLKQFIINHIAPLAIFVTIYTPWFLYQRFVDPPGDRLAKWHIAGMIEVNELTLFQALNIAYSNITLSEWMDGRIANLKIIFGGTINLFQNFLMFVMNIRELKEQPVQEIITRSFFEMFYSFWWFSPLIAIIALLVSQKYWRKPSFINIEIIWLGVTSIIALLIWSTLMFIPGSAVIHQGSFFSWLGLFIFSASSLWQVSRFLFGILATFNLILFFRLYIFDTLVNKNIIDWEYIALSIMGVGFFAFSSLAQRQFES